MKRTRLRAKRPGKRRTVHPVQPAHHFPVWGPSGSMTPIKISAEYRVGVDLRRLAKGQPCYLQYLDCRRDPQYTVLAHIRIGGTAGMGMKPPDVCAVPACDKCHDWLDHRTGFAGTLNYEQILRAQNQWLAYLWNNGHLRS